MLMLIRRDVNIRLSSTCIARGLPYLVTVTSSVDVGVSPSAKIVHSLSLYNLNVGYFVASSSLALANSSSA